MLEQRVLEYLSTKIYTIVLKYIHYSIKVLEYFRALFWGEGSSFSRSIYCYRGLIEIELHMIEATLTIVVGGSSLPLPPCQAGAA